MHFFNRNKIWMKKREKKGNDCIYIHLLPIYNFINIAKWKEMKRWQGEKHFNVPGKNQHCRVISQELPINEPANLIPIHCIFEPGFYWGSSDFWSESFFIPLLLITFCIMQNSSMENMGFQLLRARNWQFSWTKQKFEN